MTTDLGAAPPPAVAGDTRPRADLQGMLRSRLLQESGLALLVHPVLVALVLLLTWEDIPMIACGLGRITQADVGPAAGRWPRLVEIILDGLRAPGSGKLPRPV